MHDTTEEMFLPAVNYMVGNKIFILTEINDETCAKVMGDLSTFIFAENRPDDIRIFINSPGGSLTTVISLISLLNLARLYGISITTIIIGLAGSAASLLAAQGDIRLIGKYAEHFIHFGAFSTVVQKVSEIEKSADFFKRMCATVDELYLKNSLLTVEELAELKRDEFGYISAEKCLELGLVDNIIENILLNKELSEKNMNEKAMNEKAVLEYNIALNRDKEYTLANRKNVTTATTSVSKKKK